MQLVRVRVLQEVQQGPTGVIEPLGLVGQTAAVLLVVGQDVQHGLPLVSEALVELAQVAHDVEHRAALGVAFPQAALQHLHVRAEAAFGRRPGPGLRDRAPTVRSRCLRHGDQILPALSLSPSLRKLSSSFSRAIIFSSRPTTTSSNFSRSKIFSCSSLLDFSRSWTTFAYSRISRRMPMAPITLPSGSRSAEALRVVGITSPLALRGLSRALRVTPRSTTSRRAARNARVSSGEMMRDSDCSISSSGRKPRSAKTASLACKIFPSRSDTNTGSGVFFNDTAATEISSLSLRVALPISMAPITLPSGSRSAE